MTPDILLVDMEMPRMNGVELTSYVRGAPALGKLPLIMITSRSTAKHREQAADNPRRQFLQTVALQSGAGLTMGDCTRRGEGQALVRPIIFELSYQSVYPVLLRARKDDSLSQASSTGCEVAGRVSASPISAER